MLKFELHKIPLLRLRGVSSRPWEERSTFYILKILKEIKSCVLNLISCSAYRMKIVDW